jgi:hypothetical protein
VRRQQEKSDVSTTASFLGSPKVVLQQPDPCEFSIQQYGGGSVTAHWLAGQRESDSLNRPDSGADVFTKEPESSQTSFAKEFPQ